MGENKQTRAVCISEDRPDVATALQARLMKTWKRL